MSNFSYSPSPTAGMVRCKACGVQKPRTEFPVVDHGRRIGNNCHACHAWAVALASVKHAAQESNKETLK